MMIFIRIKTFFSGIRAAFLLYKSFITLKKYNQDQEGKLVTCVHITFDKLITLKIFLVSIVL